MGRWGSTPVDGQHLSIRFAAQKNALKGRKPYCWCTEGQRVSSNEFMSTEIVMRTGKTDITEVSVGKLDNMESQSHTRSLSPSSSSSFDSCSDLLGSLDLLQKGVQQQETKPYIDDSVKEDAEGLLTPIDASRCEGLADQLLERSALLEPSSHLASVCESPLSSSESVDQVTCSKMIGKYPSDPETVIPDLRKGMTLNSKLLDKSEEHVTKGTEPSKENFGGALDNEDVMSDINPFQQTKDDTSVVLLPSRDLSTKDTSAKDLVDWHIQRFLNSEMVEVNAKTHESSQTMDGASLNFPIGDSKPDTGITDIVADDACSASQFFTREEQGGRSGHMENHDLPAVDPKGLDPLKLQGSENLLFDEEASQIQEQSSFHSIFRDGTNDKGRGIHYKPENGMKVGVKDLYDSSSNVAFGQCDLDEFVHEFVQEETCDINPVTFGNNTHLVEGLVEGANHVSRDHIDTQTTKERMSDISESDDDLQQLEDTIKFFDLQKSNSFVPHPLHSFSSGSGRPDLEEVDKQFDSAQFAGRNQSCPWPLSNEYKEHAVCGSPDLVTKAGLMTDEQTHSGDKELRSANMSLELDSEDARVGYRGCLDKADESQVYANERKIDVAGFPLTNSEEHHVISGLYPNRNSVRLDGPMQVSDMKATEALDSNSYRRDTISKSVLGDRNEEIMADSLDWKDGKHWPLSEEDMFGKVPMKRKLEVASPWIKSRNALGWEKEDLGPDELSRYVEALDLNETYVDTVLDMEDVLLNSDESSRGRFLQAASSSMNATPRPSRDGSLSSSTSGTQIFSSDYTSSARDIPFTIDWVEVVGARQRKGGSSLGERMVGVKDHTVYSIKVVSGKEEWEVLRRYRDFVDLYHQLRRIFNTQAEKSLPSPWEEVELESRKVFGSTSPNIIEVRSFRIESCLQSLLQAGPPFNTTSPLFWFLRPKGIDGGSRFEDHLSIQPSSLQKGSNVQLGALDSPQLQSPQSDTGSSRIELDQDRSPFSLGKTIKLVLKIQPNRSLKQLLYAQHYSCAGCYKHLDLEKGVMQGFVQTLGWRKPRFCEYSGQLFCASCHLNETAVLPAQVLRHWDFTARRVCQLAKAYLDSIYDQPMLCVSAVNPYLYSRVPILTHIKETRRKLSRMLSCVHCPSRARIQQTLGSRRYLLESNDFFALRDLEDLSKGAFAVLPGLLTAVLENLKVHITKQCSVCQDTGEWCGAGILCEDPFSPIFPFQEDNVINCKMCHAPFHKNCFMKCRPCPCCTKDWSNEVMDAADSLCFHKHEGLNDHGDTTTFSDDQSIARNASSSSLTLHEFQGSSAELEKKSKSQRNWDFNKLFKGRLW